MGLALFCFAPMGLASPLTGTYVTGGSTTGTGPWTLSAGGGAASSLSYLPDQIIAFADLTKLSVSYVFSVGGIGGDAPRIEFTLDVDENNAPSAGDKTVYVRLGTPPSYQNNTAASNALSDNDLLNPSPGRFNTVAFDCGSGSSNYFAALGCIGEYGVLSYVLVLDTPSPERSMRVTAINIEGVIGISEPSSAMLFLLGLAAISVSLARLRKKL